MELYIILVIVSKIPGLKVLEISSSSWCSSCFTKRTFISFLLLNLKIFHFKGLLYFSFRKPPLKIPCNMTKRKYRDFTLCIFIFFFHLFCFIIVPLSCHSLLSIYPSAGFYISWISQQSYISSCSLFYPLSFKEVKEYICDKLGEEI